MSVVDVDEFVAGSTVSLPALEKQVLTFWQEQHAFQKSIKKGATPYVFYDGPPFATGLPHHGHLLASTIKDIVARYFTMQGFCVERRFGWDCHGLPIEYEIDKQQKMPTYKIVEQIGVAGYNDLCRDIVQLYTSQWQETVTKLGRWVDFDNDYKTMDPDFMESVWWVFKSLWEKDLVYQGTKVVPYSTALGTGLSNFEAGSNYQDVQDPSLFILLPLLDDSNASLIVWTTTPWTLPANLGVCVGSDIDYCLLDIDSQDKLVWLAKARVDQIVTDYQVVAECKGRDLVGKQYQPLFDYFSEQRANGAFRVYADNFVSTEDGTGVVHMAPAFGEDDHRVMLKSGVDIICPVDDNGFFTQDIVDFKGEHVKQADKLIIQHLKQKNLVFRHETIVHSYPHCPRSDAPLIYKAIPSWYIEVTALKDRLLKANEQINWVPGHIKHGRFGDWLANVKDWAVSRNRVWGTPIPLWVNDYNGKIKCIGSREELHALTGVMVDDLHREHVDDLVFEIENEPGVYRRIADVFDCWFESGSMPYAQNHYPFKGKDEFEAGFPAAFIAEGLDQTRGWFYTLTVLSVALFDTPAFKNVIVFGIVAAEDGKKMSKRLKNYTPPVELIDEYGADALRLYLINSGLVKGQEQRFKDQGVKDMVRHTLLPWYNAAKFLLTYAQTDNWTVNLHSDEYTILDKWLLSRLQSLKAKIADSMSKYELYLVVPELLGFLEDLTNIYIRFNRNRFWADGMAADKLAAYTVLYSALKQFSTCMAPFAPFCAESIYQLLKQLDPGVAQNSSVHYLDYPAANTESIDALLEAAVLRMHQVVVLGRQCRNEAKIKTKIPLKSIKIIHKDASLLAEIAKLEVIVKQELNVQNVIYETKEADFIELKAQPCSPVLGKKFGKGFVKIRVLIEAMTADQILEYEKTDAITLAGHQFNAGDINILRQAKSGIENVASNPWVTVKLDCSLNQELLNHGLARELVNRVQKTRKEMRLNVSDRIKLKLFLSNKMQQVLVEHKEFVMQETLAVAVDSLIFDCGVDLEYVYDVDGQSLGVVLDVV